MVLLLDPQGGKTINEYDKLVRLVKTVNATGEATKIGYAQDLRTGFGNPVSVTYANGGSYHFAYDLHGNLVCYVEPAGHERLFIRDSRGLPLKIIDGEGVSRCFEWPEAGSFICATPMTSWGARGRFRQAGDGVLLRQSGKLIE